VLLAIGACSRRVFAGARGALLRTGSYGKLALSILMIVLGVLMITGADRTVEAFLVDISPGWLTNLTTRL
jgi:cytochrome c-type biogenesis protein